MSIKRTEASANLLKLRSKCIFVTVLARELAICRYTTMTVVALSPALGRDRNGFDKIHHLAVDHAWHKVTQAGESFPNIDHSSFPLLPHCRRSSIRRYGTVHCKNCDVLMYPMMYWYFGRDICQRSTSRSCLFILQCRNKLCEQQITYSQKWFQLHQLGLENRLDGQTFSLFPDQQHQRMCVTHSRLSAYDNCKQNRCQSIQKIEMIATTKIIDLSCDNKQNKSQLSHFALSPY